MHMPKFVRKMTLGLAFVALMSAPLESGAITTLNSSSITLDGVFKLTSNGTTANYVMASDPNGVASWMSLATAMNASHANITTDDILEGATNLYFTAGRADARIALQKGALNGLATLDGSGLIPSSQIPSVTSVKDNLFSIVDGTDATKAIAFDAQGIASTTTTIVAAETANRSVTLPDFSGTLLASDASTGIVLINQASQLLGSNAGIQYASTVSNRGQLRVNQYGNNSGVPGMTSFKSRGATIGSMAPVQPGDVIYRSTAIGVTDNLSFPLSGMISINVAPNGVPAGQGWIATDYELRLVPLAGPANGHTQTFRITSEGILHIKEQANSMAGVATLDAAGQAVVANTQVTSTSRISLTIQDGGTVPTGFSYVAGRVIGTSFTIQSSAGAADSGVKVYYQIWEPTTP